MKKRLISSAPPGAVSWEMVGCGVGFIGLPPLLRRRRGRPFEAVCRGPSIIPLGPDGNETSSTFNFSEGVSRVPANPSSTPGRPVRPTGRRANSPSRRIRPRSPKRGSRPRPSRGAARAIQWGSNARRRAMPQAAQPSTSSAASAAITIAPVERCRPGWRARGAGCHRARRWSAARRSRGASRGASWPGGSSALVGVARRGGRRGGSGRLAAGLADRAG